MTLLRISNVLPAEVGGRGFRNVSWRWPSTTRRESNLGTPGMGFEAWAA
jgi:hypothetical protein